MKYCHSGVHTGYDKCQPTKRNTWRNKPIWSPHFLNTSRSTISIAMCRCCQKVTYLKSMTCASCTTMKIRLQLQVLNRCGTSAFLKCTLVLGFVIGVWCHTAMNVIFLVCLFVLPSSCTQCLLLERLLLKVNGSVSAHFSQHNHSSHRFHFKCGYMFVR